MVLDRYGRDPGVADIVRYFDEPEHAGWHLLTESEAKILHAEIARCEAPDTGFPYMCKNYYKITTKDGTDIFLKFKETQEMVWETIRMLRLRGRGVRLLIIKARQLFISSFAEALLAYETQFNPNNRGLVVSYNEGHSSMLFSMILHMYDQLPWWLRPMIATRQYAEGIHLANPYPDLRRLEPGLNSKITVQGATQNVGVAEGQTINTAHLSEFGSWDPAKARKIIIGDFRWALPDAPNTTAILETRVQKASKFAERLWESQVELGDIATWYPLFIPIYFDRSHFIAPKAGWKPEPAELQVKARAADEWAACTNCGQLRPRSFGGGDLTGVPCRDCKQGTYQPYNLQDGQMRWLYEQRKNAEGMGDKAVVEMQQSLATNPQEAFASVTETIFSKPARDWVAATTRGECLAQGYMATDGVFHAPRRAHGQESAICWASGCRQDHSHDPNRLIKIWQPPMRGAKYCISADVSAGLGGSNDFCVIVVNKISKLPESDIQVASYRCNTISAWHFAELINFLGRWYNNALAVVDYTNYQTVGDRLLNYFHYPNLYRWFQPDALKQQSNRWHWVWNNKNKEGAWQVLDGWLRDHSYIIKDPVAAKEIRHYQRHEDGSLGAPDAKDEDGLGDSSDKIHDDFVTAMMQGIVAAHQQDPQRSTAGLATGINTQDEGVRSPGEWVGACLKCDKSFPAQVPCERDRCPFCGSTWLRWRMPRAENKPAMGFAFEEMGSSPEAVRDASGTEFSFGHGGYDGKV